MLLAMAFQRPISQTGTGVFHYQRSLYSSALLLPALVFFFNPMLDSPTLLTLPTADCGKVSPSTYKPQRVERNTPYTSTLLIVERDKPFTSTLMAM
jgi:hypothetical protein